MNSIIIVGLIESIIFAAVLFIFQKKKLSAATGVLHAYDAEEKKYQDLQLEIQELYKTMIGWSELKERFQLVVEARDALKLERGRVTITQAELETVENRLRELDEVDREIQASSLETKEELRILNKKEKDLKNKNDAMKNQIMSSLERMESIMSQMEMSAQAIAQVESMKTDLLRTQQKVDEILMQIELGNEQYFLLKQTYDALDIEYAQLYEKFSEAESMAQNR